VQSWLGNTQWIGTSPYRPHHKRKNWYVSVASFDEPSAARLDLTAIKVETLRASGPGGQHVNRTESAIRITHLPTGLTAMAQEERSQHLNRRPALARLAQLLDRQAEDRSRQATGERWRQHTSLVRGNPIRTYRGSQWLREK
jgi:peptide chain release factor